MAGHPTVPTCGAGDSEIPAFRTVPAYGQAYFAGQPGQQFDAPPQYGQPMDVPLGMPVFESHSHPAKFAATGWNDLWAAVLFAVAAGTVNAFAAYHASVRNVDYDRVAVDMSTRATAGWLTMAFVLAIGIASVLFFAAHRYPYKFIVGCNVVHLVFVVCWAVTMFVRRQLLEGCLVVLFAAWLAYCMSTWRPRIPFAAICLKVALEVIYLYKFTVVVSLIMLAVWFFYSLIWTIGFWDVSNEVLLYFSILPTVWTWQVVKNVVHTTTAGTVAAWYFTHSSNIIGCPVMSALKRSLTTSFGSICLGSLLVSILRLVELIMRHAASRTEGFFGVCLAYGACIIRGLECLLSYFNLYAFTQVAVYGKSYVQASKDTWRLVKTTGVYAVVNDNLIFTVLAVIQLIGAVFSGVVITVCACSGSGDWSNAMRYAMIGFMGGGSAIVVITTPIAAAVISLFVCYAEDPHALQRTNPDLFRQITEAHLNLQHVQAPPTPAV